MCRALLDTAVDGCSSGLFDCSPAAPIVVCIVHTVHHDAAREEHDDHPRKAGLSGSGVLPCRISEGSRCNLDVQRPLVLHADQEELEAAAWVSRPLKNSPTLLLGTDKVQLSLHFEQEVRLVTVALDITFAALLAMLQKVRFRTVSFRYRDEEGDLITVRYQEDWEEALRCFQRQQLTCAFTLFLDNFWNTFQKGRLKLIAQTFHDSCSLQASTPTCALSAMVSQGNVPPASPSVDWVTCGLADANYGLPGTRSLQRHATGDVEETLLLRSCQDPTQEGGIPWTSFK